MPLTLTPATPDLAGITSAHLLAIAEKCRTENVFLIVRPSEPETMNLINKGFACKNMDIHDKSSNWGLMAGMVPVDPRFSKKKLGSAITNVHDLEKTHGQAKSVHLTFKQDWMGLIGTHFKVGPPIQGSHIECRCGGTMIASTSTTYGVKWERKWVHYADHKNEVCFLMDPDKKVYWRWLASNKNQTAQISQDGVPLYVWAYNGIPVTGDYDVWMLAPHLSNPDFNNSMEIDSRQDNAGRSAATQFYTDFLKKLNEVCPRPTGGNVFHHGAEAQNVSFTQELNILDRKNTVFCPGIHDPFMVRNNDLPLLIYEMLQHGYMATLNPKWSRGLTLGAEDMAYVRDQQIGWTEAIKERNQQGAKNGSSDAVANLETEAALKVQRLFRKSHRASAGTKERSSDFERVAIDAENYAKRLRGKVRVKTITEAEAIEDLNQHFWNGTNRGMALTVYNRTKFADRLIKMALMRKIAQATGWSPTDGPTDDESGEQSKFPDDCFNTNDRSMFEQAKSLAKAQEKSLSRTEFKDDGHGHWTPVDRTKNGNM